MSVEDTEDILTTEQQTVRQIVLLCNEIGVRWTRAITAIDCGEISSNSDIAVLVQLYDRPHRPGAIAKLIGMTTAGTTNLLDRLEARQLVKRNHDGVNDGRGVLIEITPEGRRTIEAIGDAVAGECIATAPLHAELHRLIPTLAPDRPPEAQTEIGGRLASLKSWVLLGNALVKALTLESDSEDPTPSRTAVTLCVASRPTGTQPQELLRILALSSGGITQLLDRLESRGLILRTSGLPPDKRSVIVRLTDEGQRNLRARLYSFRQQLDSIQMPAQIRPAES